MGWSRKRPLNPIEADVEITSEAINVDLIFSVHFVNDENETGECLTKPVNRRAVRCMQKPRTVHGASG